MFVSNLWEQFLKRSLQRLNENEIQFSLSYVQTVELCLFWKKHNLNANETIVQTLHQENTNFYQ